MAWGDPGEDPDHIPHKPPGRTVKRGGEEIKKSATARPHSHGHTQHEDGAAVSHDRLLSKTDIVGRSGGASRSKATLDSGHEHTGNDSGEDFHGSVNWSSAPLPDKWERRVHAKSGKIYYVDHNTQTTQWHHPNDPDKKVYKKKLEMAHNEDL